MGGEIIQDLRVIEKHDRIIVETEKTLPYRDRNKKSSMSKTEEWYLTEFGKCGAARHNLPDRSLGIICNLTEKNSPYNKRYEASGYRHYLKWEVSFPV